VSQELSDPRDEPGQELSAPRAEPGLQLDLAAAELRADRTDTHAMIEALAARLEEALPRSAVIKRRRVGGFRSKQTEVERIDVVLEDQRFELEDSRGGLHGTRHTVVRGITLKRRTHADGSCRRVPQPPGELPTERHHRSQRRPVAGPSPSHPRALRAPGPSAGASGQRATLAS
jgi:hypothetical protein